VPKLVMVPELAILLITVTVIPTGITLSSAASGTDPPTQVEPVLQTPLVAAVTVAACASGIETSDKAKITANTEK